MVGLNCQHQLLERLSLNVGASYQFNSYPEETTEGSVTAKRKDHIWNGNAGLKYEIKDWVFLKTGYEYKYRDSRFNTFD